MAAAKSKAAPPGSIKRNIGLLALGVPLLFLFLPTVVFLGIALLPTFVALVVDRSVKRYGGMTVGGLNFAGAVPYLLNLWTGDHSVPEVLNILSDVFALMTIFGSAAVGWMIFAATPAVVTTVLTLTSSRRLAALRSRQKELIEEWGTEVTKSAEDDFDAPPPASKGR